MKKNIYIVASNTAVTVVCKATSKKDAVRIANREWKKQGYGFDQDFEAYLADEYFDDTADAIIFPE